MRPGWSSDSGWSGCFDLAWSPVACGDATYGTTPRSCGRSHARDRRPFAREQYIDKFRTLTEGIVTAREANRFLADVQDLASIPAGELGVLNVALPAGTLLDSKPGIF